MSAFLWNPKKQRGNEIGIRDSDPDPPERCSPASWWRSAFAPAATPLRPHGGWFLVTHTRVELMSEEHTSLAPFSRCSHVAAVFAVFFLHERVCVRVCVSVGYHDIYRVFSCTGSCDILSSSTCVHERLEEIFVLEYSDKLISCQTVV